MSTLSTSDLAMQTDGGQQTPIGATPPLLPAFLITGLLLAAIVFIIVWRHIIERRGARDLEQEQDPTWPSGGAAEKGPVRVPRLWDVHVKDAGEHGDGWQGIMPLAAAALHAPPKAQARRPRFLVPSDRPVSFFTRMFGSERRPATHAPADEEAEAEEAVDRLQVAVLISLPQPRRVRTSYLPEKTELPPENKPDADADEGESYKGKKRSLETPLPVYEPRFCYDRDEPLEVAFGTVVLPYVPLEEG